MNRVGVVTDSTACLPSETVTRYGIEVVPMNVVYEGRAYRDGLDLTPYQFYEMLSLAK